MSDPGLFIADGDSASRSSEPESSSHGNNERGVSRKDNGDSDDGTAERLAIHDRFLDCLEHHRKNARMDFNQWLKEVVIMLLNGSKENEWSVQELPRYINMTAKKHAQTPKRLRKNLHLTDATILDRGTASNQDCADDTEDYALFFFRAELKACVNLVKDTHFQGCDFKEPEDRFYSLFRDKVLGRGPQKLSNAIKQRQKRIRSERRAELKRKKAEQVEADEAYEAEKAKRDEAIAVSRARARHSNDSSGEEELDFDITIPLATNEELRAEGINKDDHFSGNDSSGNETSDSGLNANSANASSRASGSTAAQNVSNRPSRRVGFWQLTAKDRLKMQPSLTKDEQIAKLRRRVEQLETWKRKCKSVVDKAKIALASVQVEKQRQQKEVSREKALVAAQWEKVREEKRALQQAKAAVEQDRRNLESLNTKTTKGFW